MRPIKWVAIYYSALPTQMTQKEYQRKRNQQSANWVYTQHDIEGFWNSKWYQNVNVRYHIFQVEEGKDTQSWHVQGFIQFTKRIKGTTLENMIGSGKRCFVDSSYDPDGARKYCMKEDTRVTPYEEFGNYNGKATQGDRTDLNIAKDRIREHGDYGKCLDDYSLDPITSKYPRWVHEQISRVKQVVRPKPTVNVYYGPTNTGKTARCHDQYPGIHEVRWDHGFINYVGQDAVLFDEFDKAPWPFDEMLKLLDVYPFQVNIKGGHSYWRPSVICITASSHPEGWFTRQKGYEEEWYPQFARRLSNVIDTRCSEIDESIVEAIVLQDDNEMDVGE